MSKTVTFQNDGLIDEVSIKTFGVNAKDNDNAIGYFGTGLKYAIAVILREGCEIVIQSGDNTFSFSVEERSIRGKDFSLILMNGEVLGFTTELGKNWKLWQAFRELYCNAADENGETTDSTLKHSDTLTTIRVIGNAFHKTYLDRDNVILMTEPLVSGAEAEIHGGNNPYIFYRGIRIYDGFDLSLYTYNITGKIDISEDRAAKYSYQMRDPAALAIISCSDKKIIKDCILAEKSYFESDLEFSQYSRVASDEFLSVAKKHRRDIKLNLSVIGVLSKRGMEKRPKPAVLTDIQNKQLAKAIKFCSDIGYPVNDYPIIISSELKGGLMGQAEDEQIYIGVDTFGMGTKYLASTLIEEYLHLHTGYGDMTRQLQSHLFNDIVTLGERLLGEPI